MKLGLFYENIDFRIDNENKIESLIEKCLDEENKAACKLNYIFTNDEKILEINKKYLNHDYFTDVITFDYSDKFRIKGDIFISVDTVKSNSEKFNVDFNEEMKRVIIHGLLHLCGYNDKFEEEKKKMTERENYYLQLEF